jgi:histidyl-tRNA synthetase
VPEYRAPIGTFDVLPPQSVRWERLVARFSTAAERAGFGFLLQPVFEDYEVFSRVGEATDIVRKEMYDFEDKGGRRLVLRPEGTAAVVRAFVQHRPTTPWKTWYGGPNFRYERPQAGRYRQFHQLGVEALGTDDPDIDVEVVALAAHFFTSIGLQRVTLLLNSLGDGTCRPPYRRLLLEFLEARRGELCDEHQTRYVENPLRVLDCKKPQCVAVTADAPLQVDHLCEPCAAHFARVRAGLDAVGVKYEPAPRLVRGLDYYTRTTFEFAGEALESAQNALGGGGRYDGLVEELGGPPTPGIGFALGIERILLACDAEGVFAAPEGLVDVFVIDTTGGEAARDITAELRAAGVSADRAYDNRSWKAQLKAAQRSAARLAVSVDADKIELRTLQEKGEPETVDRATIVDHVKKRLL